MEYEARIMLLESYIKDAEETIDATAKDIVKWEECVKMSSNRAAKSFAEQYLYGHLYPLLDVSIKIYFMNKYGIEALKKRNEAE